MDCRSMMDYIQISLDVGLILQFTASKLDGLICRILHFDSWPAVILLWIVNTVNFYKEFRRGQFYCPRKIQSNV